MPIANDALEEGSQTFDFQLAEGDGYTVDPAQNSTLVTITDDNGGPGVGPTVGVSVDATDLSEGDPLVVTFTVDGEIPAEGVEVLVQSPVAGALGQFDLADLGNITTTGIEGLPSVGDGGGGSFFITITEPTATISLNVFDDILAEEPLEIPFDLANGETYEINPEASGVVLNIVDDAQPVGPTVGIAVDNTDVTEGESVTLTFTVDGEIPAEGLQVLVNDINSAQNQLRSLTEFDVANIDTTGIEGLPTPADGDSGFFVTITEPTATLTIPVFDEGADEDEENESFTFEVIDGEAYEVDEAAGSVTLNISDVEDGGTPPTDPPTGSDPVVSVALIGGTFGEEGELVLPYILEDGIAGSSILSMVVQSDGPVPEEGLVVNINTDLADITEFIGGSNFVPTAFGGEVLGAIYDESGTATGIQVRLDKPNTVVNFTNGLGLEATGPQDVSFFVEAGEGYTPSADAASITVYDSGDQIPVTPAVVPEIGISVNQDGPLVEGNGDIQLDFTVTGPIPPEGVVAYVSTGEFAGLVDFELLDAQTIGAPFPAPDGQAGGFYIQLKEPTASLILQAREDEEIEGLESIDISLQPVGGYAIAEGAQDVSILLADSADSLIQVSLAVEPDVLIESEETVSVHTFSLSSAPPEDGVTVTVDAPNLGEFDLDALVVEGGAIASVITDELDQPIGFELTITEQTATVSLPVEDQRAFTTAPEGSDPTQTAVFELAEPAADASYQINPEANSGEFTIVETPEAAPAGPLEEDGLNDTIATANASGLSAENTAVTINGEISGNFFDEDLSLRTDQTEDVDMYSVDLAVGDVLRIDTDARILDSEDTPDTVLRLFDVDGNELAGSDDDFAPDELFAPSGTDSYLEFTAETAGTYYVGVSSFGNGTFDFFVDDDGNLENDPYDPNVVGSGAGRSDGPYTINLTLNEAAEIETTEIPISNGEGPAVSLSATPATYDGDDNLVSNALVQFAGEDNASILTVGLSTDDEIPEEGIEVFLISNIDLSTVFDGGSPFTPSGAEVLGAIFDENGTPVGLRVNLTANTAIFNLNLESPEEAPTDGVEKISFTLEPSAGYTVSGDGTFSTPVYDTLTDVPELPTVPTVGISISESELIESEGTMTTLTFTLDSPPPAEGVVVNLDSGVRAALGEFNVFDAEITGGEFPSPNFQASGFFFKITDQTATITLSAFDETTNPDLSEEDALEGIDELTFTVQPGVGYAIAPDASDVTLTIADNPDSVPLPGEEGEGEETPDIPAEVEFSDTIADAIATGLTADNPTYVVNAEIDATRETRNFIDATEDVDMYAFDLEAGQTITIDVDGGGTGDAGVEGSTLDSILRVFDASGNEVAISENDGAPDEVFQANGDTYLVFTAPEAGTYYAGVSVLGNTFYDPNVQASGSGWIFEGFEPGAYRLTATLGDGGTTPPPTGDLPVVSFTATPTSLNEAAGTELVFNFDVAGEFPEDGIVVRFNEEFFETDDQIDFNIFETDGLEFVDFEETSLGRFTVDYLLTQPNATLTTAVFDDNIAEADGVYTAGLLPIEGANYTLDPDASSVEVSVTDGVEGIGGPTLGLTVDSSEITEGDALTLTLTADGELPEGGLDVNVGSDTEALLGEFVTLGEDGNPLGSFTGIEGFPAPNADASGFVVTMVENTATITIDSVFSDGLLEGTENFELNLLDGENYDLDAAASAVNVALSDADSTLPVVSLSSSADVVAENADGGGSYTLTFNVEGEIPPVELDAEGNYVSGGLPVRFDGTDVEAIFNQITGGPVIEGIEVTAFPEGEEATEYEFTLLDNTATITLEILDDVIQEADQAFAFGLIASGDAPYLVDGEAAEVAFTLEDGEGGPGVGPAVGISVDNSELAEGDSFTVNFAVDGEIPADGLTVRVNSSVAQALGEFNIFDEEGNPAVAFEGIAGFPEVGDATGSSFLVTLTEPTASLTLSVFEDGPTEGLETFDFELIDGEIYEVNPEASSVTLNISDGGEESVFAAESGVTSVFLDFPLLEEVAGLTLVDADSNATPFSEDFQVGFAITDDTDFTFAPAPFTPLGGAIEHDGTITLGLGDAEATIGDFTIGFDPSRVSEAASGFFVADTLEDPLGLEVLFDIGAPGRLNVGNDELEISSADLLLAPELADALGLAELAGADVGDARVDAAVMLEDGVTPPGTPPGTPPDTPNGGTDGSDRLTGTDGDDTIDALAENDFVEGGLGNDTINGGSENDELFGGEGDDTISGDSEDDQLFGDAGNDILMGGSEDDVLFGGAGQDILAGGSENDQLSGEGDRDVLIGDMGNDVLSGGAGDDVLMGVTGRDTLTGGEGADLFVFGTGDGTDSVEDFEVGTDRIGLVEGELTFADLTITQSEGQTVLGVASTGETRATLQGIDASSLTESSFEIVPNVATVEDAVMIL
ncbi:MAG: DVUA0089 family protein [Phormidesmis sp.]